MLVQAWTTNPFIMTQKDGYLHGRGTSDNKGPILAMLFAVKELLDRREGEACAGLPCNLSFIFEVHFHVFLQHCMKNVSVGVMTGHKIQELCLKHSQ